MKYLSILAGALLAGTANASINNVDQEFYDCNFAGETAKQSVINKKAGMTPVAMKELFDSIPSSDGKSFYIHYSVMGYAYDDANNAYNAGYASCVDYRS
jgi:hypothetical protein